MSENAVHDRITASLDIVIRTRDLAPLGIEIAAQDGFAPLGLSIAPRLNERGKSIRQV